MIMNCQIFADFPDHRVTGRCHYSISDLLTIALLTYLCGGEDYVDMSEFAHLRARKFGLLGGNETSPSPDTFERLMSAVDPAELDRCLREHGKAFLYGKVSDTSTEMEGDHGRIEERTCRISGAENIEDEDVRGRWPGLRTIVEVTSRVTSGESVTTSVRHYISDEDYPKAAYYAMLARGHWGIENQLHWHLDVTFHEDACRARKGFAAQNLSTVRKLALQIVKSHNDKKSIRKRIFRAALSQDYLFDMLLNAKI